jgi:23S rRNA (cytidine1920-2'-O)/16S rRNA (cytidine1409-2'-O)-methyltransferase
VAGQVTRLDVLVAKNGLAESRERAQALILAGKVRVAGETVRKPDRSVSDDAAIVVDAEPAYASRGALKLAPALDHFRVDPAGRVCADIGASTGGFTDVLLRRGATRVYALDVGRGLLHWRLRQDPRVVVIERTNARDLESFPEPVSLVVIDVSFIGLEKVLPAVRRAAPEAEVVALFKPQFEVGRQDVGKGGIVRDQAAIERALAAFREWSDAAGYGVEGEAASEVAGAEGNREVFVHLRPEPT